MIFHPKNKAPQQPDNEQLARRVACQILAFQTRLAEKLNRWMNGRTKANQKRILWLFCGLFALALVASSGNVFNILTLADSRAYHPSHIGQQSYRTGKERPKRSTGDSIIFKK